MISNHKTKQFIFLQAQQKLTVTSCCDASRDMYIHPAITFWG
jgi:hypothetical protein